MALRRAFAGVPVDRSILGFPAGLLGILTNPPPLPRCALTEAISSIREATFWSLAALSQARYELRGSKSVAPVAGQSRLR